MPLKRLPVLAAFLTWSAVHAVAAPPAPDAVATQVTGQVGLSRPGQAARPVAGGTRLFVGDKLLVAPGAAATLLYPNRPAQTLRGGAAGVQITIARAIPEPKQTVLGRIWTHLLQTLTPPEKPRVVGAARPGDEGAPPLQLLRPANTREWASPPVFRWLSAENAACTVVVLDAEARQVWAGKPTKTRECAYAADGPQLTPGTRYWWSVRAWAPSGVSESPLAWFELVSDTDRERVFAELRQLDAALGGEAEPVSRHVSRAVLLAAEGLYADAAVEAAAARALRPDDTAFGELLAQIISPVSESDKPVE